jgi:hypothetical protein
VEKYNQLVRAPVLRVSFALLKSQIQVSLKHLERFLVLVGISINGIPGIGFYVVALLILNA